VSESHAQGEEAHDLAMRLGLAQRCDRRVVHRDVVVAPGAYDVEVLELGGGGQDDVRVAGRVGEEVLQHHREEIFASEAFADS
jgi:hypothetical protein